MKIYNSLTRTKEEFFPLKEGRVGMYVCGPTVYGPPHVGHARSYINFDIVNRYLTFLGNKVKYIQNITDVGHLVGDGDDGQDKILAQAVRENVDPYEIAYKYETMYFDAMDKLNIKRPSISCRATGFINEMIEMVEKIIKNGYGYVTNEGNVYFSVHKYKNYGQLSNRKIESNLSGERIDVASDKEFPEDFALWKKAENGHIMKWNSPWSVGYPGWHCECSAMSKKFLGDTFDIHGGGIDNIFPHHESEIAQSEVSNKAFPMKVFMHNNLVTVNGTKMGKSLGNFITLEDLFKKNSSMALRYFVLQFHYRSLVDFNEDGLNLAETQFSKIETAVNSMREIVNNETEEIVDETIKNIYQNCIDAMNEDFNTPLVIAEILKFTKELNKILINKDVSLLKQSNKFVKDIMESIMGFKFNETVKKEIPQNILDLCEQRMKAKKERNFSLADELRKEVMDKGYEIMDKADGFEIKEKNV